MNWTDCAELYSTLSNWIAACHLLALLLFIAILWTITLILVEKQSWLLAQIAQTRAMTQLEYVEWERKIWRLARAKELRETQEIKRALEAEFRRTK